MFHKKHTVKEVQALGRSDAKKLRSTVSAIFGEEFNDVVDAVWDKKGAVSRRRWQFGPGASAVLFLVNELPLVVSVEGLPVDSEGLLPKGSTRGVLAPTVFFFLRARQFLLGAPERYDAFVSKMGVSVQCRGPTSRFLLSGAHLMIPGILAVNRGDAPPGTVALIFSVGTLAPYAVGLTTSKLANGDSTGVGVYIVNCFTDSLWREFEATFVTSCADKSGEQATNPLPAEFHPDEVLENLTQETPVAETVEREVRPGETAEEGKPTTEESAEQQPGEGETAQTSEQMEAGDDTVDTIPNEDGGSPRFDGLFAEEDDVLAFALFEAVKSVSASMIPLPLTQFTAMVVNAYPRVNDGAHSIDFRNTKYKRALVFVKRFEDVVEVSEVSPGVHTVTKLNKFSVAVREHNRKYSEFLSKVQKPAREQEARAAELRLMADKKTVFNQQILSVETNYRPRRNTNMPDNLARVLLESHVDAVVAHETKSRPLPSLEEVENGQYAAPAADELPPVDDEVYATLYSRKCVADNLRAYIKARGLLRVPDPQSGGGKGVMPCVRLEGALSAYQGDGEEGGEMALNKLEEIILKRHFNLVTEITIQTSVSGSSALSEFIPPRHIVKHGLPPRINVWTEKRSGNKTITILKNLEALGFDLDILCRAWRQRFSTSCSVLDPASEMHNLKSGTKIPLEIHIGGDATNKLSSTLTKELGIPAALIQNSK